MISVSPYVSIIILHVNVLNSAIKSHRKDDQIKEQDTSICYLHESHFSFKDLSRLKGMEKGMPCKRKTTESKGSYTYIRQNRL